MTDSEKKIQLLLAMVLSSLMTKNWLISWDMLI